MFIDFQRRGDTMNIYTKALAVMVLSLGMTGSVAASTGATQQLQIHIGEIAVADLLEVKRTQEGRVVTYSINAAYVSNTSKDLMLMHAGKESLHLKEIEGKGEEMFEVSFTFNSEEEASRSSAEDLKLIVG